MIIAFTPQGWEDYHHWQSENAKLLERLNRLIEEFAAIHFRGSESRSHLKKTCRAGGREG